MFDWYFSDDDGRLITLGEAVQLSPKAAAILSCLMRHAGETVSVDTFLEEVWPGLNVTSDLVREYISDLRAALHDDAKSPSYIETVRGKGFRLVGGVTIATSDVLAEAPKRTKETCPSVAVLKPVVTGDPSIAAFADEIADDLINGLARFHYISVAAHQHSFTGESAADRRSFAEDIGASYLLETKVANFGNTVRVRFQLVDAATGRNLWADRFDHTSGDILQATDHITSAVLVALTGWHGELHRAEYRTVARKREGNLNAFEHFILGCDLEIRLDAEALQRALFHLEKAVTLDPTFARAWLVFALTLRWAFIEIPGRDKSYLDRSAKAFETAFNLMPGDPVTLAFVSMKVAREGNLSGGVSMLDRAEAAMAGDADAMICVAAAKSVLTDDINDALRIFDAALTSNKTAPTWYYFAEAGLAFMAGQYERCASSSLSGPQELSSLVFRCLAEVKLGKHALALGTYEKLLVASPQMNFARFAEKYPIASPARRAEFDQAVGALQLLLHRQEDAKGLLIKPA